MKKMMDLLKIWFGGKSELKQECSECILHTPNPSQEGNQKKQKNISSLLGDLETYLFTHYDFRFNVLTEQTEFRKKSENTFRIVDQRMLNSFCMDARKQGINCWDKDVSRLLLSQEITDFHPFTHYANSLPEWDGIDRVSDLA